MPNFMGCGTLTFDDYRAGANEQHQEKKKTVSRCPIKTEERNVTYAHASIIALSLCELHHDSFTWDGQLVVEAVRKIAKSCRVMIR
jgi:hypothetical protein